MTHLQTIAPDLLSAALEYAGKGLPVFPCDPDTKRPFPRTHGFKDATTDERVIRSWWAEHPGAMIGMPTGARSGVWVLDIDDPELFEANCPVELPETRRCDTGKGYHLYFRFDPAHPVRNTQRNNKGGAWPIPKLPGAETRGDGGYVIVPPSLHPSGKLYRWASNGTAADASADLLRVVAERAPKEGTSLAKAAPPVGCDSPYGLKALEGECAAIRSAGNGTQEGTLNEAALKVGALVAGGELSLSTATAQLITAGLSMNSYNQRDKWTPASVAAKVERGLADGAVSPRRAPGESGNALAGNTRWDRNSAKRSERSDPETGEVFVLTGDISEDAIALAFTSRFKDTLRFDHTANIWFEYDGTRWRADKRQRAFSYARELGRLLSRGDKGERGLCRAAVAGGAERFARSDAAHAVDASVWDLDPMLLGTPLGTVDLSTGKMRKAAPQDYITKQTAIAPESGEPTLWLKFLDESLGGNADTIRFLQQWCGYCLTGLTSEHALFFIYGPGGNGKSVFLNTLAAILNDYAVTAAMETFTASKNDRHSTELAMLAGARMVTASETEEGRAWAEAKVKQMTGGDPITARFMHKDFFTFRPQFKLTIAGNHAPTLRNVDDAMRRRFNIVPFTLKPANPDRQLEEKLRAEHGQILAWAIAGCLDWQKHGLVRPAPVTEATADYFESQDLFGQWIADGCETGLTKWEQPTPLYNAWCAYSREAGEDPGALKTFTANLQKRGFPSKRTGPKGRFYSGIALNSKPTIGHFSDGSDA